MREAGFNYVELSITSAVISVSALGILSLMANLTTSVQQLSVISQVRSQAQSEMTNALIQSSHFKSWPMVATTLEKKPSEYSKAFTSKQSKLTEITVTSRQEGKDFVIKHTVTLTTLAASPLPVHSIFTINLAHKPD
ncbi:type IV pilus modification PilV family protein [Alteromonas ponticola]|uniref:Type II secretion system protein n=1 Tax=Alteromonas ponticola TaxID=2720613 RepID=A0ABX1QXK5_9ALTE|nr:hypothetical protein [Alteromonas ponticola]NMH58955.1 hypothetical protein [Alteromonas ponticola]